MPTPQNTSREYDWAQMVREEQAKETPPFKPVDYRFSGGGQQPREFQTVDEFYTA